MKNAIIKFCSKYFKMNLRTNAFLEGNPPLSKKDDPFVRRSSKRESLEYLMLWKSKYLQMLRDEKAPLSHKGGRR